MKHCMAHRHHPRYFHLQYKEHFSKVLKRKFDTKHKQRRPMTWWSPETSDQWKQKEQEAKRKTEVLKTFPLGKTSTCDDVAPKLMRRKSLKTFKLREDLTVIAAAIKHQFVSLLCTKCAFHPCTHIWSWHLPLNLIFDQVSALNFSSWISLVLSFTILFQLALLGAFWRRSVLASENPKLFNSLLT